MSIDILGWGLRGLHSNLCSQFSLDLARPRQQSWASRLFTTLQRHLCLVSIWDFPEGGRELQSNASSSALGGRQKLSNAPLRQSCQIPSVFIPLKSFMPCPNQHARLPPNVQSASCFRFPSGAQTLRGEAASTILQNSDVLSAVLASRLRLSFLCSSCHKTPCSKWKANSEALHLVKI